MTCYNKMAMVAIVCLLSFLMSACSKKEEPLYAPLMVGAGIRTLDVNIEDARGEKLFNDANNYKEVSAMGLESKSSLNLEYELRKALLVVAPDLPNIHKLSRRLEGGEELSTDFILTFQGASIRLTAVFVYHLSENWKPGMMGGADLILERIQTADTTVKRKDTGRMDITLRYVDGKLQLKP